jgi:hypothetical protein
MRRLGFIRIVIESTLILSQLFAGWPIFTGLFTNWFWLILRCLRLYYHWRWIRVLRKTWLSWLTAPIRIGWCRRLRLIIMKSRSQQGWWLVKIWSRRKILRIRLSGLTSRSSVFRAWRMIEDAIFISASIWSWNKMAYFGSSRSRSTSLMPATASTVPSTVASARVV